VYVSGRSHSLATYESNVLYTLRFMVDTNMGGGQWLELPPGGCKGWQRRRAKTAAPNMLEVGFEPGSFWSPGWTWRQCLL